MVDEVSSYAGLRTIGIVNDAKGRPRIALNGKITFLHGPLDQGFWPDGIYTAPTDDALRFDLERTKAMGMNFVRKHAKVEPARWYYWADKLGLMVWQDMPSLDVSLDIPVGPAPDPVPAAKANFEKELSAMVDQLRSVTSIIGWVAFNEGWGEFDTARIADAVKAEDPTRMVNAQSGVNCCKSRGDTKAGDVYDDHTYVGPGRPMVHDKRDDRAEVPDKQPVVVDRRVMVDGEYGGLGLVLNGNRWPGRPQAYEMTDSQARLTQRYVEVSRDLEKAVREDGLSGAIYTQTTDVENEVNGYLSYDRRLVKMRSRDSRGTKSRGDRRRVRGDGLARRAEAAIKMSVFNAHGLHEGMGHNRTYEPKSSLLQSSCELAGFLAVLSAITPSSEWTPATGSVVPSDVVQRHRRQQPGIVHGCFDLGTVADDRAVAHQEVDVAIGHGGHDDGVEVGEGPTERLALVEHDAPGQSILEVGRHQCLEQRRFTVDGYAPLQVVVSRQIHVILG